MRVRSLWFVFLVMLMLLLPPLFAQIGPGDAPPVLAAASLTGALR